MANEKQQAVGGGSASQGPATDARNTPVIDPTKNVLDLFDAGTKRQDDLRKANNKVLRAEMHGLATVVDIFGKHAKDMDELRAYYAKELRDLDDKHRTAIRQIDVTALQALAVTTSTTAESLRSLVQSTAQTIATQTANTFQLVIDRVAALEKTSYEGSGKSTGIGGVWSIILGLVSIIGVIILGASFLFGNHSTAPPQLQIPPGYVLVPANGVAGAGK
jgi:hypothetical protein